MSNKITIVTDKKGHKIVQINEIIFKGKQNIDWKSVEKYAKKYVNELFAIAINDERIYIDKSFPNEFSHSVDTERLRGGNAKAKANAIQGIPELIEISDNPRQIENYEKKHEISAKYGWQRYTSRFSLPILENEIIIRYNVYIATILIRLDADHKKYLYDIVNIKKETEYPA